MRALADELRIAEQAEVVLGVAKALGQELQLIRDVVDAQCSIEARDPQCVEGEGSPARYLSDQVEVILADPLREFVDGRAEQWRSLPRHGDAQHRFPSLADRR